MNAGNNNNLWSTKFLLVNWRLFDFSRVLLLYYKQNFEFKGVK